MSMQLRPRSQAKRLVSMTLSSLLVLYSLPPAAQSPEVFGSAETPRADEWMLTRQWLDDQGHAVFALMGDAGHQLWHVRENAQSALNWLPSLSLSTPIAEGHHHYTYEVPNKDTINFVSTSANSVITKPPITPNVAEGQEYEYTHPLGDLFGKLRLCPV